MTCIMLHSPVESTATNFLGHPRKPARARPRPPIDPQIQTRVRALAFKSLDIVDGILDRLKAEQAEPPALPVHMARRQIVNVCGVPKLCERGRCRRTKLCQGEPAHCLAACLPALPHELLARVLSTKAMKQRLRRK